MEVLINVSGLKQQQKSNVRVLFSILMGLMISVWTGQSSFAANIVKIVNQPIGQVVSPSQNVTFNVKAEGSGLSYQWYHYLHPIPGAISPSYTVSNVSEQNAGRYMVTVTNAQGAQAVSSPATLSVMGGEAVALVKQPANQIVDENENVQLNVVAKGADLHYQWYNYGFEIEGANSPTLTLKAVGQEEDGLYYCMISSASEQLYTSVVRVTVNLDQPMGDEYGQFQSAIAQQSPQPALLESHSQYSVDQFAVEVPATDGPVSNEEVNIAWDRPDAREDGILLPVTDIASYQLYRSSSSGGEKVPFMTISASALEVTLSSLSIGTHYFSLSTVDSAGMESRLLSEFSVTLN